MDTEWQKVRLSMKGKSTKNKLIILDRYLNDRMATDAAANVSRYWVQVSNYINALKRGGLLNMDLTIKRG